jgi:hypothetical protein
MPHDQWLASPPAVYASADLDLRVAVTRHECMPGQMRAVNDDNVVAPNRAV